MSTISFRVEDNVKEEVATICKAVGLPVGTLLSMFCKKIVDEQRIPTMILERNQMYAPEHVAKIQRSKEQIMAGKGKRITADMIRDMVK